MTARTSVPTDTQPAPGVRRLAEVSSAAVGQALSAVAPSEHASRPVDVRADAYGHGLEAIVSIARGLGFRRFLVSPGAHVEGVRHDDVDLVNEPSADAVSFFGGTATLRLIGEVLAVKTVAAGTGVSYGYTFRASTPTRLALVGLGFADGIPRVASNLAPVRVGSASGRIAGRIAMDQLVVALDVGSGVGVGDDAVLFGDPQRGEPSIAEWAEVTGLSPAQLCTRLGRRIQRMVTT